jgi:hypothetical protein
MPKRVREGGIDDQRLASVGRLAPCAFRAGHHRPGVDIPLLEGVLRPVVLLHEVVLLHAHLLVRSM